MSKWNLTIEVDNPENRSFIIPDSGIYLETSTGVFRGTLFAVDIVSEKKLQDSEEGEEDMTISKWADSEGAIKVEKETEDNEKEEEKLPEYKETKEEQKKEQA